MKISKKSKNKKGMSAEFLVGMIIVIASFMLLMASLARFLGNAEEKEAEQLCSTSVIVRAGATLNVGEGSGEGRLSPLLCKTIDKKIKGNKEEVQEKIAQKMVKCWEMFGAGKYSASIFENTNLFGNANNCFVCYVMPVEKLIDEKKEEKNPVITEQEFQEYLRTHNPPKLKETSYLDYIQQKAGGLGYVMTILTEQGITEDRAYAIVYKGKKTNCGNECTYLAGAGLLLAAPAAVVIGTGAVVGGTVATILSVAGGAGVGAIIKVGFTKSKDIFRADFPEIDGLMVIDLGHKDVNKEVFEECNYVPDIAGK